MKIKHVLLIVLILAVFALSIIFLDELRIVSRKLFSLYGLAGVAVMVFVMDVIIQPISPDVVIISSTLGGANLLRAALVGGGGSVAAGIAGYFLGKKIGSKGLKGFFSPKHFEKGEALFKKYGLWAVAAGALTPVPFSAVCWSAGIYRMKFPVFILTSVLTRVPRFFVMGWVGYMFFVNK
jgi:membrane protein YqaA with SNARE-associated domain